MCSQEDTVTGDIKVQLSRSEEERRKLEKECAIYQSQLEVRTCLCVYVVINTHILYSTCTYVCVVHNIEMVCTMLDFRDMSSHNSTSSCTGWLVATPVLSANVLCTIDQYQIHTDLNLALMSLFLDTKE